MTRAVNHDQVNPTVPDDTRDHPPFLVLGSSPGLVQQTGFHEIVDESQLARAEVLQQESVLVQVEVIPGRRQWLSLLSQLLLMRLLLFGNRFPGVRLSDDRTWQWGWRRAGWWLLFGMLMLLMAEAELGKWM